MNFLPQLVVPSAKKLFRIKAKKLLSTDKNDLIKAATIIKNGGIVAFPFNGIYGLFGDINNKHAAEKIYRAKNRPKDKKLIMVIAPEFIKEYAQLDHLSVPHDDLITFWKNIHALGVILPSGDALPITLDNGGTILTIWTEYEPLRFTLEEFRKLGGSAFIGTSANKSGQPTHFESVTLWSDFAYDVDAIIEADFNHLDDSRKKSTTVVDMTTKKPRLHRIGNVSKEELELLMSKYNIPPLTDDEPLIIVQGKTKSYT